MVGFTALRESPEAKALITIPLKTARSRVEARGTGRTLVRLAYLPHPAREPDRGGAQVRPRLVHAGDPEYKRALPYVLVVFFMLQIFGVVTRLFFQVIIDKGLVDRGLSTLDVLVIGLAVITLFEVLLGGRGIYVFALTRIIQDNMRTIAKGRTGADKELWVEFVSKRS
jgi:hypothetical protein